MKIILLSTAAVIVALSATSVLAKGHDQGFGAGLAGKDLAGMVDEGQKNAGGMGSATAYGTTDASLEDNSKKAAAQAANKPQ